MWFDPAVVEAVRDAFPAWTAFAWALVSYLGSVWFVVSAVVCAYVFGDRHRFAPWVAIVMGAYAVMVGLKGAFDVARPGVGPAIDPAALPLAVQVLYAPAVDVVTTSFPSGHAIAGTVIWTMLALETDVGSRRTRFAVAATMIVLVAFSRIAVGLHYPVDVVAGVVIGLGYLAIVFSVRDRVAARDPDAATTAVFATVAVLALLAFVVGSSVDAAALFGGAVGGLLAWRYARPDPEPWPVEPRAITRVVAGLAPLGIAAVVLLTVDLVAVWLELGASLVLGVAVGAVVIALPGLFTEQPRAGRANDPA